MTLSADTECIAAATHAMQELADSDPRSAPAMCDLGKNLFTAPIEGLGQRLGIVVAGGNESGKTSLADALFAASFFNACLRHAEDVGMANIAPIVDAGNRVVITHGNGPQVGFILLRSELTRDVLHQVPLANCVADTQGSIGMQIAQTLQNAFQRRGSEQQVVAVVTQVLVDAEDPSFTNPTKPIGPFYDAERAALDFALAAASVPNAVDDSIAAELRKYWNEGEIVEMLGVISLFGFLNRWNDSMGTSIEPGAVESGEKYLSKYGWETGKHGNP